MAKGTFGANITSERIADLGIDSDDIADNAVVGSKILNDAITGAKLADNISITTTGTLDVSGGTLTTSTAQNQAIAASDIALTQTLENKTLISPVINTGVSGTAFIDDDTFGTATSTNFASAESIKAYVDDSSSVTGYARLYLTGNLDSGTMGDDIAYWNIEGDTTNITKNGATIYLGLAGVYLIIFNVTLFGTSAERQVVAQIRKSSYPSATLAQSTDSFDYLDGSSTSGSATCSLVKSFTANYELGFRIDSESQASATCSSSTHATIVRLGST